MQYIVRKYRNAAAAAWLLAFMLRLSLPMTAQADIQAAQGGYTPEFIENFDRGFNLAAGNYDPSEGAAAQSRRAVRTMRTAAEGLEENCRRIGKQTPAACIGTLIDQGFVGLDLMCDPIRDALSMPLEGGPAVLAEFRNPWIAEMCNGAHGTAEAKLLRQQVKDAQDNIDMSKLTCDTLKMAPSACHAKFGDVFEACPKYGPVQAHLDQSSRTWANQFCNGSA